ncbi:hypothetical protein T265_06890 [Opisthorchis viverrini]|uniref:Uncharacterized protein n=1 Tax=Opisthorchis viverrini TaxID=6198 RepID=A0A074ZEW2_OPIVI|nr:hypothetical protein T265_06890 [Opisthorchis viverrini]KER25718.1 hypothetical protein T265_06890 [Opisthorchis viverrini]
MVEYNTAFSWDFYSNVTMVTNKGIWAFDQLAIDLYDYSFYRTVRVKVIINYPLGFCDHYVLVSDLFCHKASNPKSQTRIRNFSAMRIFLKRVKLGPFSVEEADAVLVPNKQHAVGAAASYLKDSASSVKEAATMFQKMTMEDRR